MSNPHSKTTVDLDAPAYGFEAEIIAFPTYRPGEGLFTSGVTNDAAYVPTPRSFRQPDDSEFTCDALDAILARCAEVTGFPPERTSLLSWSFKDAEAPAYEEGAYGAAATAEKPPACALRIGADGIVKTTGFRFPMPLKMPPLEKGADAEDKEAHKTEKKARKVLRAKIEEELAELAEVVETWPNRIDASWGDVEVLRNQIGNGGHTDFGSDVPSDALFCYENPKSDNLIMVEERIEADPDATGRAATKSFHVYTYFNDKKWREIRPDRLPLFGLKNVTAGSRVMIHEGAATARHVAWLKSGADKGGTVGAKRLLDAHPFKDAILAYDHVGWCGGAQHPELTDWSSLNICDEVLIAADNDKLEMEAVPIIAKAIQKIAYRLQYPSDFSLGFDLKEDMPEKLFTGEGEKRKYHSDSPRFDDLIHPATWMTNQRPNPNKGRREPEHLTTLRDHATSLWAWCGDTDEYICLNNPSIRYKGPALGTELIPYSDWPGEPTVELIDKARTIALAGICYEPAARFRAIIQKEDGQRINVCKPTPLVPLAGDVTPFLDFMNHLVPITDEREWELRWIATVAGKPKIWVQVGLLHISERQGSGKSTLMNIIAKLVGERNTSWPNETSIMSSFNGWAAEKRLVVIQEIYAAGNWSVYNKLKTYITDPRISSNQKYKAEITVNNRGNVIANSNHADAMAMDTGDRRWFVPTVSEELWGDSETEDKKKFCEFYRWLNEDDGYGKVLNWALTQKAGYYLFEAAHPPMTYRKRRLIEDHMSEEQRQSFAVGVDVAERVGPKLDADSKPVVGKDKKVVMEGKAGVICLSRAVEKVTNGQRQTRGVAQHINIEVVKGLKEAGLFRWSKQIRVGERMERIFFNRLARVEICAGFNCVFDPATEAFIENGSGKVLEQELVVVVNKMVSF